MIRRFAIPAVIATCALAACEPPNPTVQETPLVVISEEPGFGPRAQSGDLVTIKYRLTTPEGREILRDNEFRFVLGTDSVIDGIDEAVRGMQLHGKRVVNCPPHKHWGRPGYGNGAVPPDTHLIIEVELLEAD